MNPVRYIRESARRHPWLKAAWAIGVAAIATLSLLPAGTAPPLELWDKAQHAIAYCVVGVIGIWAASGRLHRYWVLGGLMALGIVLEIAQIWVPGRQGSVDDVVANAVGLFAAGILWRAAKVFGTRN